MLKKTLIACALLFAGGLHAQEQDLVKYVNTLQGTNSKYELSYGNTYPGEGWKYQYFVGSIRGFQQSHQCSSWVNDYGVYTLMPVTGKLVVKDDARASNFKHENEIAKPHYYKVTFDNKITTEMSPTERGAHLKFTFPKGQGSYIVLDGYTKMSMVKILPKERKIIGWVNNVRWAPDNFKNYFVIQFDKPFKAYGTWENKNGEIWAKKADGEGNGIGAYLQFADGETVTVKTASSYVSNEQAEVTLVRELGKHKKFEDTKNAAYNVWNKFFNRVLVEGGSEEEKATFYSCLFRANLFSHSFFEYDKNGKPYYYSPYDGKLHDGYMYTDNGFWDTFRAQFPLNTIMHPKMQGQYVHALVEAQKQCGWFPSWSQPGETGGMIGNHAISLITDAWVKGIRTIDPKETLAAYYHEATNKGPWGAANGRPRWKEYYQSGFIPYPESEGSLAQTLESAYDDFCGYQLAKQTGNEYYEGVFARQMYNYKYLYDPSTRFMRGRQIDGEWVKDFDPLAWGGPYTEGNAWHWQWSVFHDVQGLQNLMGGEKNFIGKMDSVFTMPSTIVPGKYGTEIHEMTEMKLANMGQYAHGNQPIQHPGDEDQGQMSSWYVLSALGIYSVCPGTDQYAIGSPVFKKATITLENGKKFVIEANNNSKQNVYIQTATLNGKTYNHNFITHGDITNGGVLKFEMGAQPNTARGINDDDKPFSLSAQTVK
ncbi:MAG: glycoside hydrolase family 92 protein [Sphingobacteriaceae bacterium]|nr:MAG: glycoside hydrolase family 92 protein [Sphingobacteriaceae bacterium]